jgi:hypothetical protein
MAHLTLHENSATSVEEEEEKRKDTVIRCHFISWFY